MIIITITIILYNKHNNIPFIVIIYIERRNEGNTKKKAGKAVWITKDFFLEDEVVFKKTVLVRSKGSLYLEEVYLVTALVPSDTACLASSPGRSRRTAVWISLLVMVERLL